MAYLKYQADYLFTGTEILNNNAVLITDKKGIVETITTASEAGADIEQLQGLLTPGFINCHCHLELSHMKGLIPKHTGLVDFILHILQLRHSSEAHILEAISNAEAAMKANGIVAVGDISNNALTLSQKLKGNLQYHNFIEVSGFSPGIAQVRFNTALAVYRAFKTHFTTSTVMVPHAPYSVSPQLFQLIDGVSTQHISSIHNQETKDENAFFLAGEGLFNKLYQSIGSDIASFFKPSKQNSLQTVIPQIQSPKKLLLVHDTFTSQADIYFLQQQTQDYVFCLCVNANQYIENLLPPINLFRQNNCSIVLGTDSLASNCQLSIVSEIQTIAKHFTEIPMVELLSWATINGAKALNMDSKLGSFSRGKQPGIVLIDSINHNGLITSNSKAKVILPA
ncbi:MAG: amidohydrolase family protein [Flavobacterium sp.]|nr:amidohydrolase family protein [Flavobacterium sp.]